MTTIRSLMLAQQARHEDWTHPATERTTCLVCDESWPCADRVTADAVLAQLDEAKYDQEHRITIYPQCRLVPDPEPSDA